MCGMDTETRYTVKQLARIAGVSARTLHYYDEIGLLRPERNPYNGYRQYGRTAVLRLQQILFLRELGLSLDEIRSLLDRPDFDLLQALERHRQALRGRMQRLGKLVHTVEQTIQYLKGNIEMETKQLFEGLSEEKQAEYEQEALRRWGEKARESQQRWKRYTAEEKQRIGEEGEAVYRDLLAAMPLGPASPAAQHAVARWHQHIRYFYEPTPEILLGLANAYNDDPDFNATFVRIHPDLAGFMRQAVQIYVEKLNAAG